MEQHLNNDSRWLTIDEASRYLKVSSGSIRNWMYQGKIPFVKNGGVVRLNRFELDEWLMSGVKHGRQ